MAIRNVIIWLAGILLAGTAAPAQPLPGMHLTFNQDFAHFAASPDGMVAGRPAWQTAFHDGSRTLPNNHEAEYYADPGPDGPFHAADGILTIRAAPQSGLPANLEYSSGLITSQKIFAQRYGYFEMRAQLPAGAGLWPAFWLLPADGSWPPEIDVMEMLGGTPDAYYVSTHAAGGNQTTRIAASGLTTGFHNFGVAWQPGHVAFYLDNVLVHETPTPAGMNQPMYLLANLAVGGPGSWPGAAISGTRGNLRIAWIKAWQFGP